MKKKKLKEYIPEVTKAGPFLVRVPIDIDIQNHLADEMLIWVQNESVYEIEDFPISKSMAPSRFFALAEMNPYFEESLDVVRMTIANRMVKAWRSGLLHKEFVTRMLPLYHKEFRALSLETRRVIEDSRNAATAAIFNVGIPEIPMSRSNE